MADNLDNPVMEDFGIQDTIGGAGNTQLLNDLMEPESTSTDAKDLEPIIKEVTDSNLESQAGTTSNITTKSPDTKTNEPDPSKSIRDFLSGGEEEGEGEAEEQEQGSESNVATDTSLEEDGEEDDDTSSQFTALANELMDLGVFTKRDEEEQLDIKTPEDFLQRFNEEKEKGSIEIVNNFIGQFGEEYQEAFNSIFVKGVNPKEYFSTFNQVQDFTNMDLSSEENQKIVLKEALANQGFESEDIDAEIERLSNYGDLEAVAKRNHKVLIKKEATKLQEMEQESVRKLQLKQSIKNQYIENVQNIIKEKVHAKEFDGIPINPKLANELHDFLLVDKYKTPTGETLTDFDKKILELKNPENHATKVKIGLLLKMLEKDPTLSTIQKTGITKKTNNMFENVVKQNAKRTTNKKGAAPRSWFSN